MSDDKPLSRVVFDVIEQFMPDAVTIKAARTISGAVEEVWRSSGNPVWLKGVDKPETVAVTFDEGEEWQPFPIQGSHHGHVHAIKFEDGSVWDTSNGWRTRR